MLKKQIMKIAKATAMLLGFPLFSFVLFVASFPMIQQEHAGNFAMNWLIVTIVIWVVIEVARYVINVKIKNKDKTVSRLVNLAMVVVAALAIIMPTAIYGAVIEQNYNNLQKELEKKQIYIEDYDYIAGWHRGYTNADSNKVNSFASKIDGFIADYNLDGWNTTTIGSKEDNKNGIGYYPGVRDKIKDEYARKAAAEAKLKELKAELEKAQAEQDLAKVEELTQKPLNIDLSIGSVNLKELVDALAAAANLDAEKIISIITNQKLPEGYEIPEYKEIVENFGGVLTALFGEKASVIDLNDIDGILAFVAEATGMEFIADLDVNQIMSTLMDIVYSFISQGDFIDNIVGGIANADVSGVGEMIASFIKGFMGYANDNVYVSITMILHDIVYKQSELGQMINGMLEMFGVTIPESIALNQEILIGLGNSPIEAAEAEVNSGWSTNNLKAFEYELDNYPQVLAYANYSRIAYIFAGVIVIMMLVRMAIEEKEQALEEKAME